MNKLRFFVVLDHIKVQLKQHNWCWYIKSWAETMQLKELWKFMSTWTITDWFSSSEDLSFGLSILILFSSPLIYFHLAHITVCPVPLQICPIHTSSMIIIIHQIMPNLYNTHFAQQCFILIAHRLYSILYTVQYAWTKWPLVDILIVYLRKSLDKLSYGGNGNG